MQEAAAHNHRGSGCRPTGGQHQTEEPGPRISAGGIRTCGHRGGHRRRCLMAVGVGLAVGVFVGVGLAVGVFVGVGLAVGVFVGVGVAVGVFVGVGVGVGVGQSSTQNTLCLVPLPIGTLAWMVSLM